MKKINVAAVAVVFVVHILKKTMARKKIKDK